MPTTRDIYRAVIVASLLTITILLCLWLSGRMNAV
jgi:hypothetical protein